MKSAGGGKGRVRAPVPRGSGLHFEFAAGTGRHRVWGTALLSQGGLSVNLLGGVPHVGAVAISIPRPSLADPRRRSATTSVFSVLGHKEDELARPFAADLARALNRITVVVAGVHITRARPEDLIRVFENAGRALEAIVARVRADGSRSGARGRRGRAGRKPAAR